MTDKEIGEMIRLRRKSRNISQAQLGALAGISPSAVGMYERGDRRPRQKVAEALADVFSIPAWAIFYSEDEMQSTSKNYEGKNTIPRPKELKNRKNAAVAAASIEVLKYDEQIAAAEADVARLSEELKARKAELDALIKGRDQAAKEAAKQAIFAAIEASDKSVEEILELLK